MTIDENDSLFEDRGARENKEYRGGEKNERKEKKGRKNRGGKETGECTGAPRGGGVPQTETHSPELCNSLLKQSHPGTLSSLHPAGSPALPPPDPSEPAERARTL